MLSKLLNLFKKETEKSNTNSVQEIVTETATQKQSKKKLEINLDKTDNKPKNENVVGKEVLGRLETLYGKIKSKTIEQLAEAETNSQFLIDQLEYDSTSVAQAWSGIKHQVYHKMLQKIEEGWSKFVDLTDFNKDGIDLRKEGYRRDEMSHWLDVTYQEYEVRTLAKAAHRLWDNAQKEDTITKFSCVSCGSPIPLGKYMFHSKNIKCEHCSFVNTYSPSQKVVTARTYAVQWLLDEAAFKQWIEMKQAEYKARRASDYGNKPDEKLLDEYEQKIYNYWTVFYNTRDQLNPDLASHSSGELASKFEWGIKDIKRYNTHWEPKLFKTNN